MSENKPILTSFDEKKVEPQFAHDIIVPQAALSDGNAKFYRAGDAWRVIIEGWLLWLATTSAWIDATDERYIAIQRTLEFLDGVDVVEDLRVTDCTIEVLSNDIWTPLIDIQACIDASTTIINIQNDIINNTTEISNNYTDIINNTTIINNVQNDIITINEQNVYNIYPPKPTQATEPDALCGAAYRVAIEINQYIQDVITDAATITLDEWLTALLGLGGWDASLAKTLWDYVIANLNPNLSSEVSSAISEVHEYLYCNELDMAATRSDINSSGTMTSDAIAAWVAAIDSIAVSQINRWVYLGSLDSSQDCSGFGCVQSTIEVLATGNGHTGAGGIYQNSSLQIGDVVTITYQSGSWDMNTGWSGSWAGHPGYKNPASLMPAQNIGALLIRTPMSTSWAVMGSSITFTVTSNTYPLYLAANDTSDGYADNSGSLFLSIQIT